MEGTGLDGFYSIHQGHVFFQKDTYGRGEWGVEWGGGRVGLWEAEEKPRAVKASLFLEQVLLVVVSVFRFCSFLVGGCKKHQVC